MSGLLLHLELLEFIAQFINVYESAPLYPSMLSSTQFVQIQSGPFRRSRYVIERPTPCLSDTCPVVIAWCELPLLTPHLPPPPSGRVTDGHILVVA